MLEVDAFLAVLRPPPPAPPPRRPVPRRRNPVNPLQEPTMTAHKRILVSLILIPTVAFAQRGGSGGSGGSRVRGDPKADWQSVLGSNSGGIKLSNRDVENISPVKLLIEKLKDKNQDSFKALDSLRRMGQAPAHEPNDDERARMSMARRLVMATVGTIRENYDAALKEALPILDEPQQKTASELLEKQKSEADEMLREQLGGR